MKKTVLTLALGLLGLAVLPSCNKSDNKNEGADGKEQSKGVAPVPVQPPVAPLPAEAVPNYRFVSFDSIMMNYNLARDFSEDILRMQSDYSTELKKYYDKGSSLEKTYADIANGVVTSDAEIDKFTKERDNFLNSQAQNEKKFADLQNQIEMQSANNMQILMDSIQSYVRDFAVANGYAAVLSAESALFYHPDLDVTSRVVEGLNARYNKVGN